MACFAAPMAEAIVTTIVKKTTEKKGYNPKEHPFLKRINWLNNMLWGGSALLAFEHIWHGEIVPYFPFLTRAANPGDAAEMIYEIATSGVSMAVLVTLVWRGMVIASDSVLKRDNKAIKVKNSKV